MELPYPRGVKIFGTIVQSVDTPKTLETDGVAEIRNKIEMKVLVGR
ncbi:MAG: hypothetical protein H0U53_08710 [Actinobacteria bacterium]|nr:hypothetical protein [Actinomycetota bacterium]